MCTRTRIGNLYAHAHKERLTNVLCNNSHFFSYYSKKAPTIWVKNNITNPILIYNFIPHLICQVVKKCSVSWSSFSPCSIIELLLLLLLLFCCCCCCYCFVVVIVVIIIMMMIIIIIITIIIIT